MPYANPAAQREYQRRWWAQRRAEVFADRVCERCGGTDGLELHHRDPAAKVSHRIYSWAWERIWAEVAKCEFLCRACHFAHHIGSGSPHGSTNRYTRHGCRCAECLAARRQEKREYRARRRNRSQTPLP